MSASASGLLVFVSGPSGVGKSTVCRRLATELPAEFAISATTRPGKPQDAQGKKYLFVTEEEFQGRVEAGEFLEYAKVFGHWYGTLKRPVLESLAAGRIVLLEIDVQGAQSVHGLIPRAMGIFLLPPSEQILLERLQLRGRDDEATIRKRFAEAQREIRFGRESGIYDLLLTNEEGRVDQTLAAAKAAIGRFRAAAVR